MTQRKPSFRFRIPWLTATQSFSRHPKEAAKSSTQSDINVPIQRSSSRPSVITPAESPPGPTKTQEASRTEPQIQSPPHPVQPTPLSTSVVVETTHSKPLSPSKSPNHVNSPPPSSYAAPQFHVFSTPPQSPSQYDTMKVPKSMPSSTEESTHPSSSVSEPMPQEAEAEPKMKVKVNSPLREITKSPETFYQQPFSTPSSLEVSKIEPASQHHPPSPLASERKNEVLEANHEENTLHISSIFQGEKDKMTVSVSDSVPNDAEPKMKSPLKTIPMSQPENLSKHRETKLDEERSIPKTTPKSPLGALSKFLQHKGKDKHGENTLHSSSTSQEQKVKIPVSVSDPMLDEAKPKMKSPLKTFRMSQSENLSKHTTTKLDEERLISKTRSKSPLETHHKILQHKEKEKAVHENKKIGKSKDKSTNQLNRHAKPSSSGTKDKKHHGARETVERKIMFATSNSSGKDIGVMSSKDPSSSISHERTAPSSEEREKQNEKAPIQKGIKDDITKFVHKISASVQPTQPMDDKKFSVITLTGDNRGATMHVVSESDKKDGSIHIHRDYKTESEESIEVSTDGEGNTNNEEDSMEHGEVGKAYVNSNIQSINNSLMFHGSVSERDPGVQVTLPQKPLEPVNHNDKDTHNQRTEFNMSRSQKSTFQPTVRRYGCKFSRGNNNEDIEIM
ncbi:uncharacterized protein LOC131596608 [Vicia villosa]|uniref:uncharacterized protein LOC131596608 n=1 Tax=Vicia villosa TaxID=3911 RepID=UPI00273BA3B0|nr:uncharacterized protein LOC131596608 [Vicia villosa]